jgi:Cu(I)/Ag(I) efflux system membrane fusion protein
MKIKLNILPLVLLTSFFVSCSGNKSENGAHDDHAKNDSAAVVADEAQTSETAAPQFDVDDKFQNQLSSVFTAYVSLKEAFVSSDSEKVKVEAKKTNESIAQVDMKLLSGAAHNDWMTYLTPMQNALTEIQGNSDIEAQRKSFSNLSDNLYKSVKAFGLGGKEAYYEYCPMAFNNEGGYWLSDNKKIRNPYFGEKMLTCGEVKETLR